MGELTLSDRLHAVQAHRLHAEHAWQLVVRFSVHLAVEHSPLHTLPSLLHNSLHCMLDIFLISLADCVVFQMLVLEL